MFRKTTTIHLLSIISLYATFGFPAVTKFSDGFSDIGIIPQQKICNWFSHVQSANVHYYWQICKSPLDTNGNRNYSVFLYRTDGTASAGVIIPSMQGNDVYGKLIPVNGTFNK
ncbi:uncharacterized protein [Onthophagus taurus]|uniref:uncharacterized protein n=1 Tax=Onthophagus taurus TaxID=166361 RepID=UPI0039BEC056